jgi:hypothetical protein
MTGDDMARSATDAELRAALGDQPDVAPSPDVDTGGTGLDVEAIALRAAAATPGPWHQPHGDFGCARQGDFGWVTPGPGPEYDSDTEQGMADAEFVAHARTDVPALLAEVARLTGELDEARGDWRQRAIALNGFRQAIRAQRDDWARGGNREGANALADILEAFAEVFAFEERPWHAWVEPVTDGEVAT